MKNVKKINCPSIFLSEFYQFEIVYKNDYYNGF